MIPGMPVPARRRCPDCGQPVLVAVTEKRRRQLLEPFRHPIRDADATGTGNVAARRDHLGTWWARSLREGERPAGGEHRYTPHKAVCRPAQQPIPGMPHPPAQTRRRRPRAAAAAPAAPTGNVVPLDAARRRRARP